MQERICPACGTPWYSANSAGTWWCDEYGAEIPPEVDEMPGVAR